MILVLDTENTTWNKGNPFDQRNFNVCISAYEPNGGAHLYWPESRADLRGLFDAARVIVAFNAKYDLQWLRKLGFVLSRQRVWCCQVAEFILGRQQTPYPSLESCADKYGLQGKLKVIEEEYWSKGINTHEIPRPILGQYAIQDVVLTHQVYQKQLELIKPYQKTLLSLEMQDLIVLADMEWNGLFFDEEKSKEKAKETETEIISLQRALALHHNIPCFNWASNDHLSALLYGGKIKETIRVQIGTYKSGKKAGQPRYKLDTRTHILPRKYTPIRGSQNKKEGTWSVDESYLRKLGSSELIEGILRIKELEKLKSTYYEGLPAMREERFYEPNLLHTSYNQVVARTGRLSSSGPNLQNLSEDAQEVFVSRYEREREVLDSRGC